MKSKCSMNRLCYILYLVGAISLVCFSCRTKPKYVQAKQQEELSLADTNKTTSNENVNDTIAYWSLEQLRNVMYNRYDEGMNEIGIDYRQFISIMKSRETEYPCNHIYIKADGNSYFDITQQPRLNDIGYIDTMLCICYATTGLWFDKIFAKELEKYLALPITFHQVMPVFENSQGVDAEGGGLLGDFSSNGIFTSKTPDGKYKIYSYDDNTGGTGRYYRTYIQYIQNGQVKFKLFPPKSKEESFDKLIQKIYSFRHRGQTYYVLISFSRAYSPSWYEFVEVVSIKNGEPHYHMEFFPKDIQKKLFSAQVFTFDKERYDNDELAEITKEIYYEDWSRWVDSYYKPWMANSQHPTGVEFHNFANSLNVDVEFEPVSKTVYYNDIIIGDDNSPGIGERKSFKLILK